MAGIIAEIAAECGVSEQAVRAWCRRNHVAKDAKGSFAISERQKTAIYQHYLGDERKHVAKHVAKHVSQHVSREMGAQQENSEAILIAMLREELNLKNEQLAVKDKQIDELNARLAEVSSALVTAQQTAMAAQALHAGTLQKQIDGSGLGDAEESIEKEAPDGKNRGWFRKAFRGKISSR